MKTVYFIRHGESETNTGGIRRGDETPLTEKGRKQADVIALRASKLPIDVLISSTMERAKDTAKSIAKKTGKSVEYSKLFVERVWPSWFTGRLRDDPEVAAAQKEMIRNFTDQNFKLADEENFEDMKKRAISALEYLKEREEEHIVVVTHGLFLRVMLATVIYGKDLSAHELDCILGGTVTENTGISIIKEDTKWKLGWKLSVFNDHAHLAD